jgi:hypothetical protein
MSSASPLIALPGDPIETGCAIRLDSRCGTPISNVQDKSLPPEKVRVALAGAKKDFGQNAKIVNGPSGYYNCAGLVLAARRTQIGTPDLNVIWGLLTEDGYVRVYEEADAEVGDVVTYSLKGHCEHIALVVAAASAHPMLGRPRILSKHGWSVEVVHFAHEGPYKDCDRSYFRTRNYDLA